MDIRWSPEADADLAGILWYIREDSLLAADRVERALHGGIGLLRDFPRMGRPGRRQIRAS
jgi:plasmid stabilization system protein ParE